MEPREGPPPRASAFANVTIFDTDARPRPAAGAAAPGQPRRSPASGSGSRRSLGRLAPPEWVDDPDFDLDFHLRRVALRSPGHRAAALRPRRAAGGGALRPHPAAVGVHGHRRPRGRPRRDAPEDAPHDHRRRGRRAPVGAVHRPRARPGPGTGRRGGRGQSPTGRPGDSPSPILAAAALAHNLRRQAGMARRVASRRRRDVDRHPSRLVRLPGRRGGRRPGRSSRQVARVRRAPLAAVAGALAHAGTSTSLRVPLDDAKRAAKALGGSVNDLFVAGAAGGAGAYHRAQGADVDELRISMPVSTRSDRSAGGNAFTPTRVLVPTGPRSRRARSPRSAPALSVTKGERALGVRRAARRAGERAAHLAARPGGQAAGRDGRLHHLERARRAVRRSTSPGR